MGQQPIDFAKVISKFDEILKRGLSYGLGKPDGQMCVEAAICTAMDLPFSDNPICVTKEIRDFKICLNDANWSSSEARAKGLRNLGIAQIGSKGVVDGNRFRQLLQEKIIRIIIPSLLREIYLNNTECLFAAAICEAEGSLFAVSAAYHTGLKVVGPVPGFDSVLYAIRAIYFNDEVGCLQQAQKAFFEKYPNNYSKSADKKIGNENPDKYLLLGAQLALDVLKELKSPGCAWI